MAYITPDASIIAAKINGTNLITSVVVVPNQIKYSAITKSIQVIGDSDAVFSLQVSRSSNGQFYNFSTQTFVAAYTSQSRLKNQNPGSFSINIPAAASGDTYTVHVWPEPHFNTKLAFGKNELYYSANIEQHGNTTITFTTDASLTRVSATAIGTSTGSITSSYTLPGRPTVVMSDLQLTVPSNSGDHGAFIDEVGNSSNEGTWNMNDIYWITTAADHETTSASTHDAGPTSTALVLDDVDDLYIGMHVSVIESGSVTATMPTITDIDTDTLIVTLSTAQTWASGKDITFRAYGSNLIKKTTGIGLELTNSTCRLGQLSTKVRTAISGTGTATSIDVNGTVGIGVEGTVRFKNIDMSSAEEPCLVNTVTGSTTAGSFTIANGVFQAPITVGTVIYIDGCSNKIFLSGTISISRYPAANQTIYVDISKIFAAGAAS